MQIFYKQKQRAKSRKIKVKMCWVGVNFVRLYLKITLLKNLRTGVQMFENSAFQRGQKR